MKTIGITFTFLFALVFMGLQAQVIRVDLKITDNEGTTSGITAATTSSSIGCASPDFPVFRNGLKEQVSLEDYRYITVMPYEKSSNETLYTVVELEKTDGSKELVEVSKYLRFSGREVKGEAASTLKDISMIEVFVKEE